MINNSSRRHALKLATLLTAGALVITGCSSEDSTTTETTESSSNDAGGEDTAAEGDTRTVTDYEGNEVEVPSDPQRVVTLHFAATEALVDLGMAPVGQGGYTEGLLPPEKAKDIENVPQVSEREGIELEAIAALEPDLILVPNYVEADNLEQLRAIAPSYIYMHGGEDRADWRGRVGQVADAVNQADKIDELETTLEERQAELKEKHADVLADRRFAVINSYNEQEVALNSDASMLGNLLGPIGVQWSDQINETVGDEDGGEFTVSLEEINNAVGDADVLFYGTNLALEPTETFETLQEEPLYKNLKTVEGGNVYPIGKMTVAGYTDAMFSLDLLDEALTDLANK